MNFSDTLIWRTRTQTRAHPRIIRFIWSVVESENASTLNRGFATHYWVCALMCFVFECECGCVYVSVYEKFSSIFRLFEISIPCHGVHSQTMKVFTIHASVCECRQNFYTERKEIHSQKVENVRKRNPIKRETEVLKTTQKKCLVLKFIRFQVRRTMTTATWQRWNHVIQKIWLFVLVIMLLTAPRHLLSSLARSLCFPTPFHILMLFHFIYISPSAITIIILSHRNETFS